MDVPLGYAERHGDGRRGLRFVRGDRNIQLVNAIRQPIDTRIRPPGTFSRFDLDGSDNIARKRPLAGATDGRERDSGNESG